MDIIYTIPYQEVNDKEFEINIKVLARIIKEECSNGDYLDYFYNNFGRILLENFKFPDNGVINEYTYKYIRSELEESLKELLYE